MLGHPNKQAEHCTGCVSVEFATHDEMSKSATRKPRTVYFGWLALGSSHTGPDHYIFDALASEGCSLTDAKFAWDCHSKS